MSDRRELSLRLNGVLEMVGVTEEMRKLHRRRATLNELLTMIAVKRNSGQLYNVYRCGSSWEGTVTPDLASDIDVIISPSRPLVVPHSHMAGPGEFLHIVTESWTRPGYAKLQLMRDGRPLTVYDIDESYEVGFDGKGRACWKHDTRGTMHGPASMHLDDQGRHFADRVFAMQCKGIPLFGTDWITRPRRYNWPTQELIDELKMMGCIFVGVGHFESQEKDLEWRLSFSLQERMMMKSLNIIQHKVYVIMKMIKRNILEISLNEESLSSYHCKTCVFYMAETTPASIWVPENIIYCLLQCLTLLLRWIKDRFCPSFFLKDSNLFDKEGFLRLAYPLERLITALLQTGHQFLYLIQSDRVGEMLRGGDMMFYKPVTDSNIATYLFSINQSSVGGIVVVFRRVVTPYDPSQNSLLLYMSEEYEFRHSDAFPGYTEEEYKDALNYALPWLHLSIGLEFAARAVTCQDRNEGKEQMKKVDCHLQQARNTDLVNVKLAKATVLLRLEKLEECFLLLQELENCWTSHVATYCPCKQRGIWVYQDENQRSEIPAECRHMSLRKLMRTRFASCVIFEPSQIELVSPPLRLEMYRSIYTRPGSRDRVLDAWFDRAVVDAKVYLYFLQYLVCSRLNRGPHKQTAIDKLDFITMPEMPIYALSHRETAFNLLGWVYMQEHRVADAMWCFVRSWQIRPDHNAAKFHVLDIIFRLTRAQAHQQINTYM